MDDRETIYANDDSQPAYVMPTIGQISGGPSGFLFNPSNSLGEKFDNKFFVNIFKGGSPRTRISMFDVEEKGAGFLMTNLEDFFTGSNLVDMDFGPDGKMYISEFNNGGYLNRDEGNIFVLDLPEETSKPEVSENHKILISKFSEKKSTELLSLMARDHQQIRIRAQFELAKRAEAAKLFKQVAVNQSAPQLQRIHGVWGLGMIAKQDSSVLNTIKVLLSKDNDAQVRIRCARVLGDHRYSAGLQELIEALGDQHPRVAMYAGIGLGRISNESAIPAIIEALKFNDGKDRFLQHGLMMGLSGMKALQVI